MGRWLKQAQIIEASLTESTTSVSSVSTVNGVFDEFSAAVERPGKVMQLLYRAADLHPDLNIIMGPRDDEGYIDRILAGRNTCDRHKLLSQYRQVWLEAVRQSTAPEHAKDNVGRRHANRWLWEKAHGG